MADYGTLFQLILAALTFVIIGMFFIVYLMIIGVRDKKRLEAMINRSAPTTPQVQQAQQAQGSQLKECPHFFGYLAQYPRDQPVPDECFGCIKAMQCMNGQQGTVTENTKNPAETPKQN